MSFGRGRYVRDGLGQSGTVSLNGLAKQGPEWSVAQTSEGWRVDPVGLRTAWCVNADQKRDGLLCSLVCHVH